MESEQKELLRPCLSVAVLCEKVLTEKDGVISLIRLVDRISVTGTSDEMPATTISLTAVIGFKAGMMRGSARIRLTPHLPSGKAMPGAEFPVLFEGDDDRGIALISLLQLNASEAGTYWFDVQLFDEVITRIPLRVVYQKAASVGSGTR